MKMNVGDSVVVQEVNNLHTKAKRLGMKIATKQIGTLQYRVWRIA